MAHGEFTHIEIPADDPQRATAFYSGLFGWGFELMPEMPDYWLTRMGPGDLGGAVGIRGVTIGPKWRNYVEVESIEATLAKVEGLGGKVVEGKGDVPGWGWFAVIEDSEGNELGIFEPLPR